MEIQENGNIRQRTRKDLRELQALPLSAKVIMTERRVHEWVSEYGIDGVYVSFSGGKDSTVLLHIVRKLYPEIEAVFVNTGLEFYEIQRFVKLFGNVTVLRPQMRFDEVIRKYGYPVISKRVASIVGPAQKNYREGKTDTQRMRQLAGNERRRDGKPSLFNARKYAPLLHVDFNVSATCCTIMKKKPFQSYHKVKGKVPFVATIATESVFRENEWLKHGCNSFDSRKPISTPMAFWTEQDVLRFIKENNISIASVYGDIVCVDETKQQSGRQEQEGKCSLLRMTGCDRTGCVYCAFGCHLQKGESRFKRLKRTHPRQYAYCIGGGEFDSDGLWKPNKEGLGMGYVFDRLNEIYGNNYIEY